jgi:hypothetical protein
MTDQELMQQALDALQAYGAHAPNCEHLMLLTSLPPQRKPCSCGLVATIITMRERLALPQMQPCAGRNCGSTNSNLHSAECFEDYEKSTGMAQPEQEPVAWIHNFIEGGISIGKRPLDLTRHPDRWTALYRESKPCPTCEALARTVMLDQTSHDTKRPWVGLTAQEAADCWTTSATKTWHNFEAALRSKNI